MPPEIIIQNERMIYKMAQGFYGAEKEDIVQAGFLGLTKAYKKYNPDNGTKFSTYAYGFTGNRPIRVRKNELKLYKGVIRGKELLEDKLGHPISYEEACSYLNTDYNLFISILNSLSSVVSVDNTELNLSNKDNTDDMLCVCVCVCVGRKEKKRKDEKLRI